MNQQNALFSINLFQ